MRYASFIALFVIASMAVLVGCGGGSGGNESARAPETFTLTSPLDEATEVDRQPTLTWQASAGAGTYTLLLADNPDFTAPLINQSALDGTSYALLFLLDGGTSYFWRVTAINAGGATPCSSNFSFTTRVLAPPTIVEHPRSLNVASGHSAQLSVSATGLAPLSYQWQRLDGEEWSDIDGAAGQTYTTPAMTPEPPTLQIRCRVTNTDGQAVSEAATLTVRRVLMVDTEAAGAADGTSWNDAYNNLQDALAAAAAIDEIWVAAGTYTPGSARTDAFQLVADVAVYGGFSGTETAREDRDHEANQTILSGEIGDTGSTADNAYHVVLGANGAILDGFTVSGGNADGSNTDGHGGGMYNYNCDPIVRNCIFTMNSAHFGGGMRNEAGSPDIIDCTFSENYATYGGGGLQNNGGAPSITNCTFSGNSTSNLGTGGGMSNTGNGSPTVIGCIFSENSAPRGGGMHNYNTNPTISNCTFSLNSADIGGGGIYNNYPSTPTITNCIFSQNRSEDSGGGIYNYGTNSRVVANCTFIANSAHATGGGICNIESSGLTITNSIFLGNSTTAYSGGLGGGMYNHHSNPNVINCTFSGNSAGSGGAVCNYYNAYSDPPGPTITNSIIWGNTAGSGPSIYTHTYSTTDPVVTYSCIEGGHAGAGNIDSAPFFVVPSVLDDLRLEAGSPCIDAANAAVAPPLDFLGNLRWDDPDTDDTGLGTPPLPDMGAFEYIGAE